MKASRCGFVVGSVYALGLYTRECPVGIVTHLDEDGVTLILFNWLIGMFDSVDHWIRYSDIEQWVRAEVERLTPHHRASDGFFYPSTTTELFLMEPLAIFQTEWHHAPKLGDDKPEAAPARAIITHLGGPIA